MKTSAFDTLIPMPEDGQQGPKGDNAQFYVLTLTKAVLRVLPTSGGERLIQEEVAGRLELVNGSTCTPVNLATQTDINIYLGWDNNTESYYITGEDGMGERNADGTWNDGGLFTDSVYGGETIGKPNYLRIWIWTRDSDDTVVTLAETTVQLVAEGEKGDTGDDAVTYAILTDRDTVSVIDEDVQIRILITKGETAVDVGLCTAKNSYGLTMTATLGNKDISSMVETNDDVDSQIYGFTPKVGQQLDMKLWKNSQLVARKILPVVSDGVLSKMLYPAGPYSDTKTYTATAKSCPMVELNGLYYYLAITGSVTGVNPADDVAAKGGTWELMDTFKAIFTEILMADFAKLAAAIFSGDYMFSQYGIDSDGNVSNEYKNFAEGTFTPNLLIDFLNGKLKCLDADISGTIKAKSVIIPMVELQLESDITLDFNQHGTVLHLIPLFAERNVTLPSASDYKLQEVNLYVSPFITRSSLTCSIYTVDESGFFWSFRGEDYIGLYFRTYLLPYGTLTKLTSLPDGNGNWAWCIDNIYLDNLFE